MRKLLGFAVVLAALTAGCDSCKTCSSQKGDGKACCDPKAKPGACCPGDTATPPPAGK